MKQLITPMRSKFNDTRLSEVTELVRSCETVLSLKFGAVDHRTRNRMAVYRRHAYYSVLTNMCLISQSQLCLSVCTALNRPVQDHCTLIHSKKIAVDLLQCKDALFVPIYNEVNQFFRSATINEFIKPFIDENFLV